jgi:hypothetical protein
LLIVNNFVHASVERNGNGKLIFLTLMLTLFFLIFFQMEKFENKKCFGLGTFLKQENDVKIYLFRRKHYGRKKVKSYKYKELFKNK